MGGGNLIGGDRAAGRSPFEHGSDATVGLATVVQVGGELIQSAAELMEAESLYAGAALLRQVVEVEYLAWAFAEDEEEAAAWLRSGPRERREMWQPRHLRDRSDGRFPASDYALHCEFGGHPTPSAVVLLPDHSVRGATGLWWFDLATHGVSIWEYVAAGAERLQYEELLNTIADEHALAGAVARWRERDPLHRASAVWSRWRRSVSTGPPPAESSGRPL